MKVTDDSGPNIRVNAYTAFRCLLGLTWLRRSSLPVFLGLTGQKTLSPYIHITQIARTVKNL